MLPLWLLAALAWSAQDQSTPPDQAIQQTIISRMRNATLTYEERLQDFICNQRTNRSSGPSAEGPRWKPLESQELELSYVNHKEHYRLLTVNGKSTDLDKRIKRGPYFTPSGEFGSGLRRIFDPAAHATIEWDHIETSAGGRTCVFRYRVPEPSSTIVMQVNLDHVRMGHHGVVWAECDSGAIMRFQTETEPAHVVIHGRIVPIATRLEIRYARVTIGGRQFLLPDSAIETALFYKTWTRAEIQFQQYRKYEANSTVKFEER